MSSGRDATSPWGESYDDLVEAVMADKDAPPVLLLAAFLYRHGNESRLRGLVADAVALNEAEARHAA